MNAHDGARVKGIGVHLRVGLPVARKIRTEGLGAAEQVETGVEIRASLIKLKRR
jgi:hypothetical protein